MHRDEERAAAILDRRTTVLASRPQRGAASVAVPQRSLIIWAMGDGLFGIDVPAVAAVIPFTGCAKVPTREPACLGVIGRAGRFYSVIAMRRLLGPGAADPSAEAAEPRHLLLLRGVSPCLALAVDRVLGRFDLATTGASLDWGGRLVAPLEIPDLLARLGQSPRDASA